MDDLDPQKLRNLSESLNELTGTVRYTSEAMQSMLGPQAAANKKLKESGDKRAAAESAAAAAAQNNVSRSKQNDAEEQKLFDQQLRNRGYQINADGNLIKTTVDLSKANKESLEVLDKRIAKERELAEYAKDPVKAFRNVSGKVNSFDGVMGEMQEKLFEMTGKSAGMAAGLTAATAVISGVSKAAFGMADALSKGERGAKVGAKAVKDLSDTVTQAAYGISAVMMFLPGLGIVTKLLGVALAAFSFATEKATKLAEMGAKYNDDIYDSFNKLSEVGLTTSKGMSGVSTTLEKLNLTSAEIAKFNTLLVSGSKDLALFGGTAASGLDKFADVANGITGLEGPARELNKKLMLLGISSDEQREHTLKYMANQTRMGMIQGKTQADLVKGATAYMEELDRIATITGIGRKEQEDAQKQVLAIEELRAAMYEAERKGDTKRQAELEAAMKYSTRLMAEGRKKEAAGVAKYYAAGKNVVDADSAMALQSSAGAIRAISRGETGENVYQAGSESAKESLKRTAGTRAIGGDVSGQIGDYVATIDAVKRNEKAQEEMKKLGLTPEKYAEKIQKEKLAAGDEALKKNVELAQIQQKTGLTLDQAAKAMDGAGLAMASSVKAFNEAVSLFAKTKSGEEQKKQNDATGSQGIGGVGAESTAIANVNSELNERQIELLKKAQEEYREAVKNGTTMQKYFGRNLDEKMQAAKDKLKLAEEGKLSEADSGGGGAAAAPVSAPAAAPTSAPVPTSAAAPASAAAPTSAPVTSQASLRAIDNAMAAPAAPAAAPTIAAPQNDPVTFKRSKMDQDKIGGKTIAGYERGYNLNGKKEDIEAAEAAWAAFSNAEKAGDAVGMDSASKEFTRLALMISSPEYKQKMKEISDNQNKKSGSAKAVGPTSSDMVPINKALEGGIFSGPGKNSVALNTNNMSANDVLTSMRESFSSVQKKSVESELPDLSKVSNMSTATSSTNKKSNSMDVLERFTEILEQKFSDVIDAISENNNIKEEILLYSKA